MSQSRLNKIVNETIQNVPVETLVSLCLVLRLNEDAAIQLRQYAAATLPPVWEIPEISGDAGFPVSIEITAEGWLRMELPCVMPRREDNDRSRLLAGLLRNAIHRAFPKHDQPRFYTCVLAV